MYSIYDLTPREQDLLIRRTQQAFVDASVYMGRTGSKGKGVDGDPGPRLKEQLRIWGDKEYPETTDIYGYLKLWAGMKVTGDAAAIARAVAYIKAFRTRYEGVGDPLGIPWYFIGIIHWLECSGDFSQHLHNGDPLTKRTTHEPAGRPVESKPPFTWAASAEDALRYEGFADKKSWDVQDMLYRFEKYNGMGYRNEHNMLSPYLWSMTSYYTKGKYTEDHGFDPEAVSKQIGAAVLLKALMA